ncbi:NAD-dependent epimerase/dehydratase family protein [uncultured Clostridium sp.]|uniref:NAD-dependent epimerase/dehydratase family protein n=1 Tax=uncultured Clostridium sp. TaxID=59620 RepID=UPI0025DD373B|nr:NAD-dependent epimerase/dehydratase family protein [uncultured Clostridium sp.]
MIKNILVMGGSYFIGRKIVNILTEYDYNVYILNRGTCAEFNDKVTRIICDRNDRRHMQKCLKGYRFDAVIDVSGLNKEQEKILLKAIDMQFVQKFIFISSSAVYDVDNNVPPYKEETPQKRNSFWGDYGTDKSDAESFLKEKFAETDKSIIILRPPYVYGEDNYVQCESFIFDHICNNKPVLIPDDGSSYLQFIYTTDLAEIIVELLKKKSGNISIYNVGNKEPITMRQWVEACAMTAGKKVNIIEYDYKKHNRFERDFFPFFNYDNVLDVSKINQVYSYETYLMDGLKYAYEWYCSNKDKIKFKESVEKNEKEILQEISTKA